MKVEKNNQTGLKCLNMGRWGFRISFCILSITLIAPTSLVAAEKTNKDSSPVASGIKFDFSPNPLESLKQTRREMVVKYCRIPPNIDGKLDDQAWKDVPAAVVPKPRPNSPETSFKICFDKDNIYIGVACRQAPSVKLIAEARPRDEGAWRDDCIEMWFDPTLSGNKFYQFIVNAAGAADDLSDGDPLYNPAWHYAASRTTNTWAIEAAIPKEALGLSAWRRAVAFNLGRNEAKARHYAWIGEWKDTGRSSLVLDGVTQTAVIEAQEKNKLGGCMLVTEGEGLEVNLERSYARPGERWIEAQLVLKPKLTLDKTRLEAKLYKPGAPTPIATASLVPERARGWLQVDLRGANLSTAQVSLEYFEGQERVGMANMFLTAQSCKAPLLAGEQVPITLDVPEGMSPVASWPVMFGMPFPAGALWDAQAVRLVDKHGKEIPCQTEATGLWAKEGAVKWLRFDALVNSSDGCFVEIGGKDGHDKTWPSTSRENNRFTKVEGRASSRPQIHFPELKLIEKDGIIIVDTGVARYVLAKGISPIKEIYLNGKLTAKSEGTRGLYVVDQTGRPASAAGADETVVIEARGPIAGCVRFEGWYTTASGEKLARHITRVEAFAGQPFVNITHTLIITEDTDKTWFKEIGWEFAVEPGINPTAMFGVSRPDWKKTYSVTLNSDTSTHRNSDTSSAYMLQDKHYYFAHGTNHFLVAQSDLSRRSALAKGDPSGKSDRLLEGEECGDWAGIAGRQGGLAVSCREAARQHPKEFEVKQDRLVLKLFSNRSGEELDFRPATLARKWPLEDWQKATVYKPGWKTNIVEYVAQFQHDFIGWAKTHEICLLSLAPAVKPEEIAQTVKLHSAPVYAHVSPDWIRKTEAMGPIHPRDPERFPEAEKAIDVALQWWMDRIPDFGDYGFMDYYAGPVNEYFAKNGFKQLYPKPYRCYLMYQFNMSLWLLYARSANRALLDFARETSRVNTDNYRAHWDSGNKTRGLFCAGSGNEQLMDNPTCLPFYALEPTSRENGSSTDLNKDLWLYHVCGYRRARDCLLEYADGIKRVWSPKTPEHQFYVIMMLRALTAVYGLTWDPELRAFADATGDFIYDPESEIKITRKRPYGNSLWKTSQGFPALVEAWETFGQQKYYDMAMRVARFWWNSDVGSWPLFYGNNSALMGQFLYRETQDPSIPEILKMQVKQASSVYDPQTLAFRGGRFGSSLPDVLFLFQGIPYAEDLIVRSGAWATNMASWAAFNDYGSDASVIFSNVKGEALDLTVRHGQPVGQDSRLGFGPSPWLTSPVGGSIILELLKEVPAHNHGVTAVNQVSELGIGAASIRVAKDAPGGQDAYKLSLLQRNHNLFVFGSKKIPMVIHAPAYWQPLPQYQNPPQKIFFKLPENTRDGRIMFEGSARLFEPSGKPFKKGAELHGWVALPPDKPGLWSFEPLTNKLVQAMNIPPFFAFADAANYFEPEIAWPHEEVLPPLKLPESAYVPGAITNAGNQALYLGGKSLFSFKAGPGHSSGDGSRFLPFKQGTIEFWFKPYWDFFDVPKEPFNFVTLTTAKDPWQLYFKDHSLVAYAMSDGKSKLHSFSGSYFPLLFEREQWVHIAVVWGPREKYRWRKDTALFVQVFVNGRSGQFDSRSLISGNLPADKPEQFFFGGPYPQDMRIAVDELRISDVMRYPADFTPPLRDKEFSLDEHTRALFHFNGNAQGESLPDLGQGHGQTSPVNGEVKEK